MLLPNRYLELNDNELLMLKLFDSFKVKMIRGSGVVITTGPLNFFIKRGQTNLKVGDRLKFEGELLVPKDQRLQLRGSDYE